MSSEVFYLIVIASIIGSLFSKIMGFLFLDTKSEVRKKLDAETRRGDSLEKSLDNLEAQLRNEQRIVVEYEEKIQDLNNLLEVRNNRHSEAQAHLVKDVSTWKARSTRLEARIAALIAERKQMRSEISIISARLKRAPKERIQRGPGESDG